MKSEPKTHPMAVSWLGCQQIAKAACYSGSACGFFVLLLGLIIIPSQSDRIWEDRQLSHVACSLHDGERALVVVRGRHTHGQSGFTTTLAIADLRPAVPFLTTVWPELSPACVAAVPSTSRALISTTAGELYSIDLDVPQAPPILIGRHQATPFELVCSEDGRTALTLTGNALFAWDLQEKKLKWQFSRGFVRSIALRPESVLAALDDDGSVVEISLKSGEIVQTVYRHEVALRRIVVSPDDRRIAMFTQDAQMIVADLASGTKLWQYSASRGGLPHLAFSVDGNRLASVMGSGSGWSISIWDVPSGALVESFGPQSALIHGLAFRSKEGLISWSADGVIRVLPAGLQVKSLPPQAGPLSKATLVGQNEMVP